MRAGPVSPGRDPSGGRLRQLQGVRPMTDDEPNDDDDSEVTETEFDIPEDLDMENDPSLREDDGWDTSDDE
jgi:hypothetical protein